MADYFVPIVGMRLRNVDFPITRAVVLRRRKRAHSKNYNLTVRLYNPANLGETFETIDGAGWYPDPEFHPGYPKP